MLSKYETQKIINALADGKSVAVVFPNTAEMRYDMFQAPNGLYGTLKSGSFYGTLGASIDANQPEGTIRVTGGVVYTTNPPQTHCGIAYGLAADCLDRARGLEFDEVFQIDEVGYYRPISVHQHGGKLRVETAPLPTAKAATQPALDATKTTLCVGIPDEAIPGDITDRFLVTAYGRGPFAYELTDRGEALESGQVANLSELHPRLEAFKALRLALDGKKTPVSLTLGLETFVAAVRAKSVTVRAKSVTVRAKSVTLS